ncbi:sensor histidine kinase [Acetobacterium fimetarium]|uniref:histidine kinase n=1 Tax=Acetobacterium fimetarium TaxID=52691 RepID=A0ABR6WUN9_9FIRM|nr:sensor histidine kinase [Acetobacterium fimetarium]MBC3804218.1 sensor histidine kinase [Acetobacterium fimetarium]
MRLRDYLFDKKFLIMLYLTMFGFAGVVISVGEAVPFGRSNGLYVIEVAVFLFFVYLSIDFLYQKSYYQKLKRLSETEGLDWVNSLPASASSQQRIYHELLQKQYREINKKLREYQSKSSEDTEFITMWVHEIKTPIAAAKLIIENSLNAPSEEVLYSIEDEIDKIEDFVQMTLFYSRADDFAKDYLISSTSLDKVVRECIKREYASITNKHLNLQLDQLDFQIDTDEKWLGFIIKQIVDNAVKYSYPNGKISIYAEQQEAETVLIIADQGPGIKAEDIRRVFDKHFTGNNGRKFEAETGFGLYLSQKIARKLGHHIAIASDYEKGTKVSVHFPVWNDYYDV